METMQKKSWLKKDGMCALAISLVLMLVSMIGASFTQTSFGNVTMKEIRFETTDGVTMAGYLLVPKNATEETPAPAVVVSHGSLDNKELQDASWVELSRHGYVVFAMDMYSHGESELVESPEVAVTAMYEAVKMVASLDYVDSERIGVEGHSMGGYSCIAAVMEDNAQDEQLISSVLLLAMDDLYVDYTTGEYMNYYGNRDVAIVATEYDEFMFRDVDKEGKVTPAKNYLENNNAQSFLHFGTDPKGQDVRVADTIYTQKIDGEEAIRVIYKTSTVHMGAFYSKKAISGVTSFFDASLSAPNTIASTNQIWQLKQLFNTIGLVGFFMFLISFTLVIVSKFSYFKELSLKKTKEPVLTMRGDIKWFIGETVATTLFAVVTYFPVQSFAFNYLLERTPNQMGVVPCLNPFSVGLWAALCGVFEIAIMFIDYQLHGKKNGFNLEEHGITISLKKLGKTIFLALIVLAFGWVCVFFAKYFFNTDFRCWVFAVETFPAYKIGTAITTCLGFFLIYYIANSVYVNSFGYLSFGRRPWINTLVIIINNALAPIILIILQYGTAVKTGFMFWQDSGTDTSAGMGSLFLVAVVIFLPLSAIVSRTIYKRTNNPYLPGIINGIVVSMMDICATMICL